MKYDPAYDDMLQYLSVGGMFNLTDGSFPEWYTLRELGLEEGL